jgi:hypothetical protein
MPYCLPTFGQLFVQKRRERDGAEAIGAAHQHFTACQRHYDVHYTIPV